MTAASAEGRIHWDVVEAVAGSTIGLDLVEAWRFFELDRFFFGHRLDRNEAQKKDRCKESEDRPHVPLPQLTVTSSIGAPNTLIILVTSASQSAVLWLGGIAWDGGIGIRTVEISSDRGKTWVSATLGPDLGRYAFRSWSLPLQVKGKHNLKARASNVIGETQTANLIHNPA